MAVQMATPPTDGCAMHPPTVVPPSENVTVPVGVPAAGAVAVTIAVYITGCPDTEGSTDDVSIVVVVPWLTVSMRIGDVEPVKLESPVYTAVIGCPPALANAAAHVAVPHADTACAAHAVIVTPPSSNITLPVVAPLPGAITLTAAVMVTNWPTSDGFTDDASTVDVDAWLTSCDITGDAEPAK
jgi:hypothetical protein